MQAEIGDRAVILGVDAIGQEPWQALVTDLSDLPWLQDVEAVGAWDLWGAEWRDVWLLDPENHLSGIYNLTEHDLAVGSNYAELMTMILAVDGEAGR